MGVRSVWLTYVAQTALEASKTVAASGRATSPGHRAAIACESSVA